MSDLQILSGLSILISGFAQLKCGLSIYHWQVLVYLAWFSSLTHLSCLTFLRKYLNEHPGERNWRVFAMLILVILLVVALLPTGTIDVERYTGVWLSDHAICIYDRLSLLDTDSGPFISMIVSVLFVSLGFMSRIVKLYPALSLTVMGKCRRYLSDRALRLLRFVYKNYSGCSYKAKLGRAMIYRSLLVVLLAFRALLDMWSSMAAEVS
jgi:hypothetical protein